MLEISNIYKQYENQPLLCGVSFSVAQDETVCLLGSSGSGKSTILRIIAGLENAEGGDVLWEGRSIIGIPPHRREFGLMFQDYALFPHLDVQENIAFGLRSKHMPEEQVVERVEEVLEMVDMKGFINRSVIDLSGGEKQRVAFARAIAPKPRLLMLDEPMGALDRTLKDQLISELNDLLAIADIPVIYVTHDQVEAFSLADRVLILHEGNIVQAGTPAQVYSHPKNRWVASFLGFDNHLSGVVRSVEPLTVSTSIGDLWVTGGNNSFSVGDDVDLVLLSGSFKTGTAESKNEFLCSIIDSRFLGDSYRMKCQLSSGEIYSFSTDMSLLRGEQRVLNISPESILCFRAGH